MDNKKLRETMFNDVKKMNDNEFLNAVKQINTYNNIKYFSGKKVDMKLFFKQCIAEMLKRKIRIPSSGFFDLIDIVDEIKSKK
jgi:hypothetical protein